MEVISDKLGFPLVRIEELGTFNLWPIAKLQFERFLSQPHSLGDSWYEAVLGLNPRVSFTGFDQNNYEGLILTGILPEEALSFGRWLGEDYDLPRVQEWRQLYGAVRESRLPGTPPTDLSNAAKTIWTKMAEIAPGPLEFTMLQNGVVEWIRENGSFSGLGSPRPGFLKNTWSPMHDKVDILDINKRLPYLGFRLIKRQIDKISV